MYLRITDIPKKRRTGQEDREREREREREIGKEGGREGEAAVCNTAHVRSPLPQLHPPAAATGFTCIPEK